MESGLSRRDRLLGFLSSPLAPRNPRSLLIWIMALLAVGTLALLGFAASAGFWMLGVTLAARLVFVLILAAAVLPWLGRRPGG